MNAKTLKIVKKIPEYLLKTLVAIAFIFPFYWMLITAFKTYEESIVIPPTLWPKQWIVSNFAAAWKAGPFLTYAKNSLVVTLSVMLIQFVILIPAAYAFARFDFKGKKIMFDMVLLAFMMPSQIVFIPTYLMMAKWSLLDTLLPQILPFAANAFGIFLLRQYFMQIPEEIIEAARLDKATESQILLKIMLPMSKSAIITIALFSFVSKWNSYFWPLVMTNADRLHPLTVGIASLQDAEGLFNWPVSMAANTILVIPILILYIFANRKIVKAFVYSGIK